MTFAKLLREAVAARAELRDLSRPTARKLSAKTFAAAAAAEAGTNDDALNALEDALDLPSMEEAAAAFRRMKAHVAEPTTSTPHHRLRGFFTDVGEAQLARFGYGREDLFALAVRTVARERPEAFGVRKAPGESEVLIGRARHRLDELSRKIEAAWTGADVTIHPDGRVTFDVTGGAVAAGPDYVDHLIAWVEANGLREAA